MTAYLLVIVSLALAQGKQIETEGYLVIPAPAEDMTPQPPRFKPGLPHPINIDEGKEPPDIEGTLLPRPLNEATAEFIGFCTIDYPRICATAIEAKRKTEQTRGEGLCDIRIRQEKRSMLEEALACPSGDWMDRFGTYALAGSIGMIVGTGLTILAFVWAD